MGLGISLVIALVGAAALLTWGILKLNSIDRVDVNLSTAAANTPRNYLIVGSDTRDLKGGGADDGAIFGRGKNAEPAGQRADTMLIARIDPRQETVEVLSLPRDLYVTIAGTNRRDRLNAAYNAGPQRLIDTIQQAIDVPINHYIEVNFEGFKGLVEAIGGVPMYFDRPVRDRNTGLNIPKKGCYNLDGTQALAFVRARHLQYSNGSRWVSEGTGDLGRITRQQIFLRRSMAKVSTLGINNLGTLRRLVDVGVKSVKVDGSLSVDDMMGLGRRFSNFKAETMVTHRLPTTPTRTSGGASVLELEPVAAKPVLDIFRGVTPPTAPTTVVEPAVVPASITLDVLNGSGTSGLARRSADELAVLGYNIGTVDNAETLARTTVRSSEAGAAAAASVAAVISPTPVVEVDPSLSGQRVVVVLGSDFDRVLRAPPSTATTTPGSAETDTPIGLQLGDPPPGVRCGA
jgi:LCP family protein required for cell wall assembly